LKNAPMYSMPRSVPTGVLTIFDDARPVRSAGLRQQVLAIMPFSDHHVIARRDTSSPVRAANAGVRPNLSHADPDKALVMAWIGDLIRGGHAEWGVLGNGDIEVRFMTGEVFHLGEATITRVN
jgi:hypothetical protein